MKNKKNNKINSAINSNHNTFAYTYDKNKEKKEIDNHRMIIFTYYKNPDILQIDNKNQLNCKGSPNMFDYTSNNYNYNYNNENQSNKKIHEDNLYDLYEKFGKYKTYSDASNELVYYNDKNLYNYRKNEFVQNFEYNYVGFANIGNTCYMNAFLQILLHTPNLLKNLRKYKLNEFGENTLLYNLVYLSQYPYNTNYLYNIKEIMKEINPEYGKFTPGDSQIFAIDLLDKLIYEIKGEDSSDGDSYESKYNDTKMSKMEKYKIFLKEINKNKNLLEKMFQFSEITKGKDNNKYSFSINLNIELSFPKDKNSSMSLIQLLEEKYQVDSNVMGNYNINNNKVKLTKIADIPEILIISLARSVSGRSIIKTSVSFSEILDIDPYIDPELKKYNKIKCTQYLLYAVNERYGLSKSQGHYVSYIKIKNTKWFRFSDLYVHQSKPSFNSDDVFGLYYIRKDVLL